MNLTIKQKIFAISLLVGLGIFGFYNVKNLNKPTIGRKQGLRWIDTQAETVKGLRNQEIVKADAKSTHFKNKDGTITAYITDFNQNAQDKNGNWKPIDFSLKKIRDKDYDYKIASGLDIKVSKKGAVSNGLLEIEGSAIEIGGFNFTEDPFSPIPYKIKSSKLDNTTLKSKTKDFDLHIDVTDQTIKHEVIIKDKKYIENINSEYIALKSTLTTKDIIMLNDMRMPSGIHQISKDDLVQVGDSEKNINTIIPFPESWDKNETDIETFRYVDNKDFYTLDVYTLVKKTDLLSADIQFPITIDPDFEGDSTDGYVNHSDTNYANCRTTSPTAKSQGTTVLRIGQSFASATYNIWRSLMKFDTSSIGALGVVTGVNMEITMADVTWLSTHFTPRITNYDWEADGPITDGNNITLFAGVHSGSVLASFASTSGWTVNTTKTSGSISTSTVDTTGYTLYGLQGSRDRDSNTPVARNWVDFYESGTGTASYRPVLVVTYYTPEIKGIGGDVNYDKNRTKDDGTGTLDTAYKELAADEHTVGLWHFNESYGNEYAYDSSGLSNDVTATDIESVDWKAGIANYGIDLDGTDEYFTRAYDTDFDFGTDSFTVEGWFKHSTISAIDYFVSRYDSDQGWKIYMDASGDMCFGIDDDATWGPDDSACTSAIDYDDDTWHHVAGIRNGTEDIRLYIDGIEVAIDTTLAATATLTSNSATLKIGSNAPTAGSYWAGMIDEVRISNVARTPEEIIASASRYPYSTYTSPILNTGGAVKSWKDFSWTENGVNTGGGETVFDSTGLVAQWNFNETSGTTADNAEGTAALDGTLSGFDSTVSQDADPDSGWTAANRRWGAGALQFDKINSSVSVSDNDSLDFSSSDSFTVLAWVKLRSKETNEAIVSKTAAYADIQANYVLDQNSAEGWQFTTSDGSGTAGHSTRTNSLAGYEIGKWTQVVGTYDASTDKMYLYTNGVLRSEITPTYAPGINAGNLYIGSYITSNFFDGIIDTVQIYSRALSEPEILSLYNSSNLQFETRIGGTSTPDSTWEAWKPTTNSTQLNSFDTDSSNWLIDNLGTAPETSLNVSDESNLFLEGSGTLKLETSYVDTSDVNLLAYWNLDETNGDNTGDDIFDLSGNDNHGEFSGAEVPTVVNGISGKARYFDSANDTITAPAASIPTGNEISITLWAKGDSTYLPATGTSVLTGTDVSANRVINIHLPWTNSSVYWDAGNSGTSSYDRISKLATADEFSDSWSFWGFTKNAATGSMKIYRNGKLWHSDTGFTRTLSAVSGNISIVSSYRGSLDEIQIFSTELNAEEIAEAYKMGSNHHINKTLSSTDLSDDNMIAFDIAADKPGTYLETIIGENDYANYQTDANTLGLWHLDEQTDDACDSGNSDACDSSGNGNHGDVTSAPPVVTGKRGLARDFDGSADYINVGTMGSFGSQIGTSTTSLWVNTTDTTAEATALLKIIDASGEANDVVWGIEPNRYLTSGCTLAYTTSEYTLFYIRDTTGKRFARYITTSIQDGQWHHVVWKVTDASTNSMEVYVDGVTQTLNGTCSESPSSFNNWTDNLLIGASNNRGTPGSYLNGVIDEVRIDSIARTTTEVRQAYEIGRRSHPITIDFTANLSSDNLIAGSGDLDFTIDATAYGLPEKGSMLFENDKLIVKENVDGTEYIAQGTVTDIHHSGGYVRVLSWDTASTFPTGGFTANATVFKWQREYFDLNDVSLDDHMDAVTELTFRITNGHEGRTVYIDDLTSEGDLMTTSTGSTIGSSTGQRYYQYKTIFSNADEFVSADVSDISVDYVTSEPDLYMKFDENYGSTVYDSSRNEFTGTITEAAWVDSGNCISRSCLDFDGTGDYIVIPDNDGLDPTGEITLTAWVKPQSISVAGNIISKKNSSYRFRTVAAESSDLFAIQFLDRGGTNFLTSVAPSPTMDEWHHIAVVGDSTGLKIYIDGNLNTSNATSYGGTDDSSDLHIGCYNNSDTECFDGFMDGVKMYRYARTAEEIKTDYNALATVKGATASFSKDNRGLTDGLIGYWKMDESAANSCTGGVNDACDSSGNDYDGAWNSDATSATGKFGNGVTFDGTADDVSIADQDAFSVNNTNELTVAGWINWDSTASRYSIINKGTTSEYEWGIRSESDGSIRAIIYTDSGGTYLTAVSSASYLSTGRWYHVAFTVDLDKPSLRLYVDGTLLAENTTTSGSYINNTSALNFGERGDGSNDFPGDLDEVRIYNKTLSPVEISKLYNWAPGPVGYWPLDENTGTTTTYDKSGNGNDGTLTSITESSWTQGKFGSSLEFDGSADYVTLTSESSSFSTDTYTTSAWVYRNTDSGGTEFFIDNRDADNDGWLLYILSTALARCSYNTYDTDSTTVINTGQWYHIACVADGTNISVYINGVLEASTAKSGSIAETTDARIGARSHTGAASFFPGKIDEVQIYDYARTPSQITQDMNGGHPIGGSPIASQVGYWSFDEMAGTTANDRGTGENSGTLNNSPTWKLPNNCKINGCVNFNGSNNYISITDDDSIDIGDKLTITGWFNVNDTAVGRPILSKANEYLIRVESDDKLNFFLHDGTSYEPRLTAPTNPSAGDWNHFAAIYDSTLENNHQKIYLNGILVAEQDRSITTTATANNLNIGLFAGTYFDGELDEIKLYNTALTASEILVDMNAGSNAAMGGVLGTGEKLYLGIGDTGPVGWWKLDENTGISTTYDSSGNGNDGTLTSITESAWVQGKLGSALEFDGSADYVDITNSTDFDIANPTISAWVYSNDFDQNMFIFEKGPVNTQYSCFFQGTNIIFRTHNTTPTTDDLITDSSDAGVSPDQWNHIACVYDGSNKIIYVNGVQADSKAYTQTLQTGQSGQRIGAYGGTPSFFFDGRIDEVKIFDYPLSPSQVAYEYNRGKPTGHWKLDECAGTTAYDSSSNGNNGTITIGATGTNTSAGTCTSGTSTEAWNNGTTGKFNGSLDFDGTDDYISLSENPGVDIATNGEITMAAWIKHDGMTSTHDYIIGKGAESGAEAYFLRLDTEGTEALKAGSWDGTNHIATWEYGNELPTGVWHHVVATYDGTKWDIYANGILRASNTTDGPEQNNASLAIGASISGIRNFDGQIDEARIYNYALSANQIKALVLGGAAQRFE